MIGQVSRLDGNYFIAIFSRSRKFYSNGWATLGGLETPESREEPMFIRLPTLSLLSKFTGAMIALLYAGQRDTKWLVPLTVSGGYQGEEGNHTY
ncbi:MAG TPA: hypothetical protein VIC84_02095 [Blastocatellia bacterium]